MAVYVDAAVNGYGRMVIDLMVFAASAAPLFFCVGLSFWVVGKELWENGL